MVIVMAELIKYSRNVGFKYLLLLQLMTTQQQLILYLLICLLFEHLPKETFHFSCTNTRVMAALCTNALVYLQAEVFEKQQEMHVSRCFPAALLHQLLLLLLLLRSQMVMDNWVQLLCDLGESCSGLLS